VVANPGMRPNQFELSGGSVKQMRDRRDEVDWQLRHVEPRFQVLHTNHGGRPYVVTMAMRPRSQSLMVTKSRCPDARGCRV
jgi:hypothetical protein